MCRPFSNGQNILNFFFIFFFQSFVFFFLIYLYISYATIGKRNKRPIQKHVQYFNIALIIKYIPRRLP